MHTIQLTAYPNITTENKAHSSIYTEIKKALEENYKIKVDFSNITNICSSFAKEVFGKLCLELEPKRFFERINIVNANNNVDLIIKVEIQNSIDEKCYKLVW